MEPASKDRTNTSESPSFRKVAECLYRHKSSGIYYALVKRSGKQYRQSLKNKDRKLAERHLPGFREKTGHLAKSAGASKPAFGDIAKLWRETLRPMLKEKSFARRSVGLRHIPPTSGTSRFGTSLPARARSGRQNGAPRSPHPHTTTKETVSLRYWPMRNAKACFWKTRPRSSAAVSFRAFGQRRRHSLSR